MDIPFSMADAAENVMHGSATKTVNDLIGEKRKQSPSDAVVAYHKSLMPPPQ